MGDNALAGGTLMGAVGAGTGYLIAHQKTSEAAKKVTELVQQKQNIIDTFQKFGYKEGMNIGEAAYTKVQEHVQKGWIEKGADCLSKKSLDKIWNKSVNNLTQLENTFKTKMKAFESSDKAINKMSDIIKKAKLKYVAIGAGAGIGLYALYRIGKSIFSGTKEA